MERLSIVIPVYNKMESTLKCINSIREFNRDCTFEIIIVDNGSTDETQQVFERGSISVIPAKAGIQSRALDSPVPDQSGQATPENDKLVHQISSDQITYIRNEKNLGVSKALNSGAEAAKYKILCFMHNDVFIFQNNWAASICDFIKNTANAGVVGLYGAKAIRKDGSFRGKSIVHAKKDNPSITRKFEKVAVVDGLLLGMHKQVFERTRGFCDGFIVHYYDKDISLRAYRNGFENYVLNIPFEHVCAATRSAITQDDNIRDEAQENFMEIWDLYLPIDVSTWRDKISYTVKRKKDS
jgi:glycosyltransferase involved in cell wall biosynthesis